MKVLDYEVEVGDGVAVGGLTVFPLTGVVVDGPPYLTGPEAFEMGLLQVSELDPPQVPFLAVTNLAEVPILLVEGEMLVGGDQNRTMNPSSVEPAHRTRARFVVHSSYAKTLTGSNASPAFQDNESIRFPSWTERENG